MLNKKIDKNKIYVDVAKLHIACIKNGFLPKLGVKFLTLLYRCIDESDFSILIVKYKHNQLIGFVSGTYFGSDIYKKMLYYPFDLLLVSLTIISNIKKIKKIAEILIHTLGNKRNKYPKAELLTICVNSNYRRQGVAVELYQNLSNYFKSKSISKFIIIVGQSLKANLFYLNQGAKITDTLQVHKQENSNLFIQKL